MQLLVKATSLLLTIIHLWVSGSLLLHKHNECHSKDVENCHHHDGPNNQDECAICYYIHLPNTISHSFDFQLSYIPSSFWIPYNISIDSILVDIIRLLISNKGPPTSINSICLSLLLNKLSKTN